jgi:hypothetical protein
LVFGAQSPYLQSILSDSYSTFSFCRFNLYICFIWREFGPVTFLYDWIGKSWHCMMLCFCNFFIHD